MLGPPRTLGAVGKGLEWVDDAFNDDLLAELAPPAS
jgi:hypothetical protein